MQIAYDKMHGCGNDYIFINELEAETKTNKRTLVIQMCDRHFGVGSDGVIFVRKSNKADFEMEMYNADGSRGEMCGNGIRCLAKYVADTGKIVGDDMTVSSFDTVYPIHVIRDESVKVSSVSVELPAPRLYFGGMDTTVRIGDIKYILSCVSVGNPHAVLFVQDVWRFPVDRIGPLVENHELFCNRTNVEFVEVIDRENIHLRVWERGSGETLACGSGSCAAAWVCMSKGLTHTGVSVTLKGGELSVRYCPNGNVVILEGPAVHVCSGQYEYGE